MNITTLKHKRVNNNITNNISKKTFSNNEHVLNRKKDYSFKNYFSNHYKPQVAFVENNLHKRSDNRAFNGTNNISKTISQYTTDVGNSYEINKVSNLKKEYCIFIDDVASNKHNTIYTNDTITVTKRNKLANSNDTNYFTKKTEHTNNITNNFARHNRNNYEHNVI